MMNVKNLFCVFVFALLIMFVAVPGFASEKIDINTASIEQLVEIKGVGEILAQRIVDYRQTHGLFNSLNELEQVKGVGQKKLEKMLPYLTLSEG